MPRALDQTLFAPTLAQGAAGVVERGGRITGYTTGIAFFAHAVTETNEDMKAPIGAAPAFPGPERFNPGASRS